MNILFMGTPDFAEESLAKIYSAGFMKFQESEVKQFAVSKNLKMYQPERVKENLEFIEEIKRLNPDLICVVAYRKDFTKRNTRYTKVWLYKSACITSSKI